MKSGDISIAGTRVVTDESLGVALTNKAEVLGGKISWDSFCQGLKDYLITVNGGTITGELYVEELVLPNNGTWYIGTDLGRCDIVLRNSSATITTEDGDLNFNTNGSESKIVAQKFLQFADTEQCGKITICAGFDSTEISSGLTSDSVITVTPAQETSLRYWVEIDNSGTGTIKISDEATTDLSFYFCIMRK